MTRPPARLVLLVFVPLQIFLFVKMAQDWGFWRAVGVFLVLGFLATRAGRAVGIRALLFPGFAQRWEDRRHVFQGILLLLAAFAWYFSWGPQPWLPLASAAAALKAALR